MRESRQMALGILAALVSTALLFGSLSLALVEGQLRLAVVPGQASPTVPLSGTPGPLASATPGPGPTSTLPLIPMPSGTAALIPPPAATLLPPSACDYPPGWYAITVQPGDTLESLAQDYNATVDALVQANCLMTSDLIPGSILYVPAAPPPTTVPCGPPWGWIFYTVQYGDTLYKIAVTYGVTVADLQFANCLGSSTLIRVGQKLYVPNVPVIVPTIPPTWTAVPTLTPPPPRPPPPPPGVVTITPTFPPPTPPIRSRRPIPWSRPAPHRGHRPSIALARRSPPRIRHHHPATRHSRLRIHRSCLPSLHRYSGAWLIIRPAPRA
jgi:LysM repeat protein